MVSNNCLHHKKWKKNIITTEYLENTNSSVITESRLVVAWGYGSLQDS